MTAERQSTAVSIDGTRTVLAFGTRYRVRYGRDSKILEDALLVSRAPNGDLVFDAGTGTLVLKVRVRPSSIDAIFGSGVDHDPADSSPIVPDRFPNETLASYLARLESEMGDQYARWIGTETGQAALAAVAAEDKARRTSPKRAGIAGGRTAAIGPKPIGEIFSVPAGADVLVDGKKVGKTTEPTVLSTPSKGRPYAERNQVWKCGTCKTRTRQPICTGRPAGSHAPVEAPAGKRRDAR